MREDVVIVSPVSFILFLAGQQVAYTVHDLSRSEMQTFLDTVR